MAVLGIWRDRRSPQRKPAAMKMVIQRIAEVAEAFAWQAGVGGMETAGSIVSYLAAHPEHVEDFIAGRASVIDWPVRWHEHGRLTWHGKDGKIYDPQTVRQRRLIRQMEKGA